MYYGILQIQLLTVNVTLAATHIQLLACVGVVAVAAAAVAASNVRHFCVQLCLCNRPLVTAAINSEFTSRSSLRKPQVKLLMIVVQI
jgi:hypothetical protein